MISPQQGASIEGKVVLVTGSTKGIGRAIAEQMVGSGATVGITSLPDEAEAATELAACLDPSGTRVGSYALDVRSATSIEETIGKVCEEFGRLDILVNNAGVRLISSSLTTTEEEWDEVTGVNLRGVFFCCQAAARQMRETGGAIVNLASQLGLVAAKDRAAYCATKAAVIHLTRALALDWAPYAIRVNAVAPGTTHTPSMTVAPSRTEAVDLLRRLPLGRPIEPVDVAQAVAFLASSQSAAITGQTLAVDGGWTLS
jgi:2-dehydro-3-deoxy-D-gluconate 5-dehydrogenase